jgi:4-diphosphocytidyl-2-C-methyl-D-erythritol kinase
MIRETAPAKVNLVLHVGPRRADGLHEICSLFASLELADELVVEPLDGVREAAARDTEAAGPDRIVCPGVAGPNLAAAALAAFRAATGDLPPVEVTSD